MTKRFLFRFALLMVLSSASVLAFSLPSSLREIDGNEADRGNGRQGHDEQRGDNGNHNGWFRRAARLPSGHYITPTAINDAVQTNLNPGLPAYPDFVAGMAVRSRLSPDGQTLAILTAGQNSLYKPDGTVDVPNSTQYIFLYDVTRPSQPSLKQVIKQVNAHVGLVFSPDGNTLYAAGGNDDAVYVYTKNGDSFAPAPPIALGHYPPGSTGSARNRGVGINVQPNASGMDVSADGAHARRRQQLQRFDQRHRHRDTHGPVRARPAAVLREQRRAAGRRRRHLPVRRGDQGERDGLRLIGSRSPGRRRRRVVADRRAPDQTHSARRQRTRDDARRVADDALRGAGQCRPGCGHQHADEPAGGEDRRASAGWPVAARPEVHGRGDVGGDDLAGRGHALRRQQRLEFDRGHPADRVERPLGERADSHRLRAARHHVQPGWVVDVHHQRQERHGAESGSPGEQPRHRSPTSSIPAATPRRTSRRARRTSTSSSWNARHSSALPSRAGTISTSSPSRLRATTSTRPRPASATSGSCVSSTSASSTSSTS